MAAATYATDLTTVDQANTTWVEPTATGWTNVSSMNAGTDTDNYIQGTTSTSCAQATKTGVGGAMTPAVSDPSIPADGAALIWCFCSAIGVLETESAGGYRVIIGNDTANFYGWSVFGKDTLPYSGWQCIAVNPANTVTRDWTAGSPSGAWTRFGAAWNITVTPSRGFPFAIDCVRAGRCEARFSGGTSPDAACTFQGFATVNDYNDGTNGYNRWGLIQGIAGGFLFQGLMTIGYGAACRFTDSNVSVSIANTKKVTPAFNRIEIRNASTEVNWNNVSFLALGMVSKGQLEIIDDCDVNIDNCTFQKMDTFIWKSLSSVLTSRFIQCGQITSGGANFSGSAFSGYEGSSDTSYLIWSTNVDTNTRLDNCTFTKGSTATHALQINDTGLTSLTLNNVTFNNYNASNGQPDSAIYVKATGGTVTINCSGTPSYKSDGATVNIVSGSKTCSVTVTDVDGNVLNDVRVMVKAKDGTAYPFEESVTITNSDTTATVSHSAHRMATGDKVMIKGASHWQNNGIFTITKDSDNQYHYTMPSAPGSNPTGSIEATYVLIHDVTSGGNPVTMSRVFSGDFDVTGWARKSSSQPYYKTGAINGTVLAAGGWTGSAVLTPDE